MTIAAANALVKHFALQERAVHIVFVSDLAVGMVDWLLDGLNGVEFVKPAAGGEAFIDHRSPRVAGRAGFDLRDVAFCFQVWKAGAMMPIPEQTFVLCNFLVQTAGAVTRLATDINLGERCRETVGSYVKTFAQVCAMAFGTANIPILSLTRPVQWIVGFEFVKDVWRLQVKPFFFTGVPR